MGNEVILRVPEDIWRKECALVGDLRGLLNYIAHNGAYRAACKRLGGPIGGTAPLGYAFLRDIGDAYTGYVRQVRRGPETPPGIYYATIDAVYPWNDAQDSNRAYLWLQTTVDAQGRPVADLSLTRDPDYNNRVAQDSMRWAWAASGWGKVVALEMPPRPTVEALEPAAQDAGGMVSAAPENCKACSDPGDYDCVAEREQTASDSAADYIWGARYGA